VIITTIQKFSVKKLDELLKVQKGKNICFIIDEAHRSQAGKLHKHMVERFEEVDIQEELLEGISKMAYPNAAFIALTATPSDKTIEMFGAPFDVYSMDQAEQEGYILNVVENVVTYSTLFKLNQEVSSSEKYPPLVIAKKIKAKAFENEKVINEKIDIILKVFEAQTKFKIGGRAKVMIVTSSRKAAAKYKMFLDQAINARGLPYRTLVAFSGSVKLPGAGAQPISYTENNLNNIKESIEDEFDKLEYRFIVVANKFQYGFNQPYLHTMFLDKAVSGINAVQTISRLNRVLVGKTDTLVVDFTDSYEKIIAAFKKFKGAVNDYSSIDINSMPLLKTEILNKNIFTLQDVSDFKNAIIQTASATSTSVIMKRVVKKIKRLEIIQIREFRGLLNKFNSTFKYLDNLVKITDMELRDFALFTNYLAKYIDPLGRGGKLKEELRLIEVISHKIRLEKQVQKPEAAKVIHAKTRREVQYVTVEEVIDAINANYDLALGDNDKELLREYIAEIARDPEILRDIRVNKNKDLERLYATTLASRLKEKAIQFFLTKNPARLIQYLNQDLLTYLNQEAFRLAVKAGH
jgi:type I restriction enzyme R subunit